MHKKSTARRKPAPRATPRTKPATPPPAGPCSAAAPASPDGPKLWHFKHTHPDLPGVLNVTVQAPDIANARGIAYLLGEQFASNVIGFIKAGGPVHLPRG